MIVIDIGMPLPIIGFVVYGWVNGRGNERNAKRTDSLFHAIRDELPFRPIGPKLIGGDINCDPSQLPSLTCLLKGLGWTDVGACASIWGGVDGQATCEAPNATVQT